VQTRRLSQYAVPLGVVLIIMMMVMPVPATLLDFLIVANIMAALVIVLVSMYVERPLDFSSFPSLLLVATLFRLALNISATRLVLSHGYAGGVINAFGHFVISGSLVIGLVIFAILLVIQFVVITNGAGRVAEVGARFTLDAMPGKQMAIDADLNAGVIDEKEARRRRTEVTAEADFYGSMDGASKFVKGDAIAAIIITLINLIGGLSIGVVSHGLSFNAALNRYSLLSIGDGLVSQIPALLLSVATGLIVTRANGSDDLGTTVAAQLGGHKRALQIAGGAAFALCLMPGLPKVPFLVAGAAMFIVVSRMPKEKRVAEEQTPEPAAPTETTETLLADIAVDPLELALSADLVDLVSGPGGDLLDRVRALRRKVAMDLGVVMPPVRTHDDLNLPLSTYAMRINGVEVARGQAYAGSVLAIGDGLEGLPGRAGREPVFGLAGVWIPTEMRAQAELLGATVVDRSSVVITHLSEVVKNHASRLLGREDVVALNDAVKRTHPTVVEDLTPTLLSLAEIQRVLHGLLDEGAPIRDLVRIYEALSVAAKSGTDADKLLEAARLGIGPAITAQHINTGQLDVLTLDPRLQHTLVESIRATEGGLQLMLEPALAERLVTEVVQVYEAANQAGKRPVLVCPGPLRLPLRRLLGSALSDLPVLAYAEVNGTNAQIDSLGVINDVRDAVR
jgi:flagellar biosynthesis protein FlhA